MLSRTLFSALLLVHLCIGLEMGFTQEASQESNQEGSSDKGTSKSSEWNSLFNEQTLGGWVQRGGNAKFQVEEDSILGTTVKGEPTSYLCTEREFENFELTLEFKVEDARINSGVLIRSLSLPEYLNGRVHGYQVEIDPSERAWTGAIYDENRRGWLYKPDFNTKAYRASQWNTMRIECQKDSIKTWINDISISKIEDNTTRKGFIALQLHSTTIPRPMSIRWRKIALRELD